MDIESLMKELANTGVSVLIKCDGERMATTGDPWTLVITGGPLSEQGPVRRDDNTLHACLANGLALLQDRGEEWRWLGRYLGH